MTGEEARAAFEKEIPVESGGIKYRKVSALIYRKKDGKVRMQCELEDKGGNSVTITTPSAISVTSEE